jgi:signal transduction protein with GAF and PtsI domain
MNEEYNINLVDWVEQHARCVLMGGEQTYAVPAEDAQNFIETLQRSLKKFYVEVDQLRDFQMTLTEKIDYYKHLINDEHHAPEYLNNYQGGLAILSWALEKFTAAFSDKLDSRPDCPYCDGNGTIADLPCTKCGGTGKIEASK